MAGTPVSKTNWFSKAKQASETNSPRMSPTQQGLETKKINVSLNNGKFENSSKNKTESKIMEFSNQGWNLRNQIKTRVTIGTSKVNEPARSRYYITNP